MQISRPVSFRSVEITDGFWRAQQALNRDVTIYAVENRFRDTGRFRAFKFDWTEGSDIPKPHYFWDSDIAKWIESAAYIIQKHETPKLYASVRDVIDDIAAHQDENGYFNIYHTVVEPDNRFRDRNHHELYCLGHLIEAAVAWFYATGETDFLACMERYIDYVIRVFVTERSAGFLVPGHEEIELALIKLYRLKREKKYLDLAMFFLNHRGCDDGQLGNWAKTMYDQNFMPVREQRTAEGHCVRACYLYSAMADAAAETGDEELLAACRAIFDDICDKKMYVTGGIGSSHCGEAFTVPYDLPNDTAYAETCAAIALGMFANRMKDLELDSKYADTAERVLFNGVLSGLSLDGKSFFYENPLEINLADHTRHTSVNDSDRLPITQRLEVFGCSCCPPNVTRVYASFGDYAFSCSKDAIYVHQYLACRASIDGAEVDVETDYPRSGAMRILVKGAKGKKLFVRIPGWCEKWTASADHLKLEKGYAVFEIADDAFELSLGFCMEPRLIVAKSEVRADVFCAAVTCGPLVYCAEGVDHDFPLFDALLPKKPVFTVSYDEAFRANVLTCEAKALDSSDIKGLYFSADRMQTKPVTLRLIPYYAFANRGESDMRVWFRFA